MQPRRHFSTDPDTRIDFSKALAVIAAVLLLGIMANIVHAARLALN